MPSRLIRLRRPAILSLQEGVFVPAAAGPALAEVERRWRALRAANPAYFDGRLCHVLGVHRNGHGGATIHVADCAYCYWAVQDTAFDLGVRPLGVKAITWRGGRVLMGRRSRAVAGYAGLWEFAPGGVVEPGRSPEETIARELQEETGLRSAHEPRSLALLFDPTIRTWEIVMRFVAADGETSPGVNEYDQLEWRAVDELPRLLDSMSPVAAAMTHLLV